MAGLVCVVAVRLLCMGISEFFGLATTSALESWRHGRSVASLFSSLIAGALLLGTALGIFRGYKAARIAVIVLSIGLAIIAVRTIITPVLFAIVIAYLLFSRRAKAHFTKKLGPTPYQTDDP